MSGASATPAACPLRRIWCHDRHLLMRQPWFLLASNTSSPKASRILRTRTICGTKKKWCAPEGRSAGSNLQSARKSVPAAVGLVAEVPQARSVVAATAPIASTDADLALARQRMRIAVAALEAAGAKDALVAPVGQFNPAEASARNEIDMAAVGLAPTLLDPPMRLSTVDLAGIAIMRLTSVFTRGSSFAFLVLLVLDRERDAAHSEQPEDRALHLGVIGLCVHRCSWHKDQGQGGKAGGQCLHHGDAPEVEYGLIQCWVRPYVSLNIRGWLSDTPRGILERYCIAGGTMASLKVMKTLLSSFGALCIMASAAHAACYADYKAKQDNPLRLHYGVAEVRGECTSRNAQSQLADRLSSAGWELLNIVSVFDDGQLDDKKDSAGEYFLRF